MGTMASPALFAGCIAEAMADNHVFGDEWGEGIREVVESQRTGFRASMDLMKKHEDSFFPVTRTRLDLIQALMVPGVIEGTRENAIKTAMEI